MQSRFCKQTQARFFGEAFDFDQGGTFGGAGSWSGYQ
jgi:hypothetical protein